MMVESKDVDAVIERKTLKRQSWHRTKPAALVMRQPKGQSPQKSVVTAILNLD